MKKQLLCYLIVFCMIFALLPVYAHAYASPGISGISFFRESATKATVRIISNTSGTCYYTVDSNPVASSVDLMSKENAGKISSRTTKAIEIKADLLSSGAKYVHIVVVNEQYHVSSNVLDVFMPYDVCYFDDFSAYMEDTVVPASKTDITASTPQMYTQYNGGNSSDQKIVMSGTNSCLQTIGTYVTCLDARANLSSPITSGYVVFEADITSKVFSSERLNAGLILGSSYDYTDAPPINVVINESNEFVAQALNSPGNERHSNVIANLEKTYHVRMEIDITNESYNYYIDGLSAVTESSFKGPIRHSCSQLNWFGFYNGSGTAYFDNIKFYTTDSLHHTVTFDPNGGSGTLASSTAIDGTQLKLPECSFTAPTGKHFKEWAIGSADSATRAAAGGYHSFTEATTVYAVWEADQYALTFDANGGSGTMSPSTAYGGTPYTLPACGFTAPTGTRFKEWAIGSADSATKAAAGSDHSFTAPTTVYAVWEDIPDDTSTTEYYYIIDGQNGTWMKGSRNGLGFTANGDYWKHTGVSVDGIPVSSDNYIAASGSTVVTLKVSYLETLSVGRHSLRVEFIDGYAETNFTITAKVNIPQTGDNALFSLWLGVALLAGAVLATVIVKHYCKRNV